MASITVIMRAASSRFVVVIRSLRCSNRRANFTCAKRINNTPHPTNSASFQLTANRKAEKTKAAPAEAVIEKAMRIASDARHDSVETMFTSRIGS